MATYLSQSRIDYLEGDCLVVGRFELPNLVPGKYTLDISFNESDDDSSTASPMWPALNIAPSDYLGVTHPFTPDMGSVMVRSEWEAFEPAHNCLRKWESEERIDV